MTKTAAATQGSSCARDRDGNGRQESERASERE